MTRVKIFLEGESWRMMAGVATHTCSASVLVSCGKGAEGGVEVNENYGLWKTA